MLGREEEHRETLGDWLHGRHDGNGNSLLINLESSVLWLVLQARPGAACVGKTSSGLHYCPQDHRFGVNLATPVATNEN
jgi:hypothetical protein